MITFDKEIKTINTKNIITLYAGEGNSFGYQRPVNPARVKKIVKEFNPNLVNPPKVSFRGGKYYCFDGNHTKTALILRNGGAHLDVECVVFYGMTYEDEARMFAEQNGISARVLKSERMKGLFEAGDEEICRFVTELKSLGIVCDFRQGRATGNRIICYDAAYKQWKSAHAEFLKAVNIINTSWNNPTAWRYEFVNSITQLSKVYGKQFESTFAIKKFGKLNADKIYNEAKSNGVLSPAKALANILLREYNRGRKVDGNKRLDPTLLIAATSK